MIFDGIINVFFGLIDGLLNLLPSFDFVFNFPDTTQFRIFLGYADYFFPVGTLLICAGIYFDFSHGMFLWRFLKMVWKLLPFT
ncbi:hypothetical protein IW492_17475 [Enterococcus sp. BWB1-3]|uniref:hypothetical protein n=1 Tax=Enterococcus sp. BWB1-3 TaxID=2787713 RepID=UPI00192430CA|nr:hypothetical protein [Enterococcus sp. BWB1-3]MBL1231018.1 hypothetical protein [Enterococcus sp. BWB1-3]